MTALREFHRTTGTNEQTVNIGDVVQIHDDVPRNQWKLAVIEGVNRGDDGYIRSVTVRTANGRTNRPIARLYPLEVSADEHPTVSTDDGAEGPSQEETEQRDDHDDEDDSDTRGQQPVRMAMVKARDQVAEWSRILRRPPEDVEDN